MIPRYQDRAEGVALFYDTAGVLREERKYLSGKVEGDVKRYFPSGKIAEMFTVQNGKREGQHLLFDEQGTITAERYYVEGRVATGEKVTVTSEEQPNADSGNIAASGKELDQESPPADTLVIDLTNPAEIEGVTQLPQPEGGWQQLYEHLLYPREAKEKGITGKVTLSAFIDTLGYVVRTKILSGIGYGCDQMADIVVYFTKFKPVIRHGKPVFATVIMNIEFRKR